MWGGEGCALQILKRKRNERTRSETQISECGSDREAIRHVVLAKTLIGSSLTFLSTSDFKGVFSATFGLLFYVHTVCAGGSFIVEPVYLGLVVDHVSLWQGLL